MAKMVRPSWGWLRRRWEVTYFVALILMVGGAIIFFVAGSIAWLQGAGGVIIGTGFTVLISTITGKRAIQEQYAKEANLRRKDNVYGPLHAELKRLREILDQAQLGTGPYPKHIDLADATQIAQNRLPSATVTPSLQWWSIFKQDYRVDDFTPAARKLLDDVLVYAQAYNDALAAVDDPIIEVLGSAIDQAIQKVQSSPEYKDWYREHGATPTSPRPLGDETQSSRDWYRRLDALPAQGGSRGRAWADSWVKSWPFYYRPATVGWLLAMRPDEATKFVHAGFTAGAGDTSAPPIKWIEEIISAAQPSVNQLPTVTKSREAQEALFSRVLKAEQKIQEGLQFIQDRYEGGSPPV